MRNACDKIQTMPDIQIHRAHTLGADKAHEVAQQWADKAQTKFDLKCHWRDPCVLEFSRPGVTGQVTVAADHFALTAELGFLFKSFAKTIESAIDKNLDELLAPKR
jgi:putative polyhydroxyalkanoate system protein